MELQELYIYQQQLRVDLEDKLENTEVLQIHDQNRNFCFTSILSAFFTCDVLCLNPERTDNDSTIFV